ncbi:MAG: glycosyltransferase family 2 protein [Ichthyobacteriaceae bacterium]|nr:glycosyltransferase family 2 protein [Ichthyobacteriaceae bacterium]
MNQIISASIVVYNTKVDVLEESILSYLNSDVTGDLWIIDNSPLGDFSYLSSKFNEIKYIKTDDNLGYGRAHNIALKYFANKTTYHLVLNPDVSFNSNVISGLINYMNSNINVGLVAPKALYPDGSSQSNGRLIPSPKDLIMRRFFGVHKKDNKSNNIYELNFNQTEPYLAPVILGSFMLFRNSSVSEINFFDERFFLYPEDIDISRRIFEKYNCVINTNYTFIHHHAQDSYFSFSTLKVHIAEMFKYFGKWGWFNDELRMLLNEKALNNKY